LADGRVANASMVVPSGLAGDVIEVTANGFVLSGEDLNEVEKMSPIDNSAFDCAKSDFSERPPDNGELLKTLFDDDGQVDSP
jgi:hypothetical protein